MSNITCFLWHKGALDRLFASKGALPHALLLSGPRGTGKLTFARALAQALLCETPAQGGCACGACSSCLWFEAGSHPDYRQLEPESAEEEGGAEDTEKKTATKKSLWITVDQIRRLADLVNMSSHRGSAKAVVIHPAETLYPSAGNALLKSLEEPPPRTYFLLVTHRPHLLLPTIRSRCQQIGLTSPNHETAAAWLREQGVTDPSLALAHTGGAPLLALELNRSEYWPARAAFMRELGSASFDPLAAADAVHDCPIPHALAWLQKWSYDLAHYAAVGKVRYNPDHEKAIARTAAHADRLGVLRFHREMVRLQRFAQHPLNPRLFLEQMLLDYCEATGGQAERV